MQEIYVDIQGKEGKYKVSNKGIVKRVERTIVRCNGSPLHIIERILKPYPCGKYGHLQVDLGRHGAHDCYKVHQLVAQAFIPNPNGYNIVHHKDHNPTNNCVENLVWMSNEEHNRLHADERAEAQSKTVYQYTLDGELVRVCKNATEIERELGYSQAHICDCCNGKRKTHKGFKWSYYPLEAL